MNTGTAAYFVAALGTQVLHTITMEKIGGKNGCIITLPATRMPHKSLMPVSLRFGIKREMMEPLKKACVPRFFPTS